MCRTVKCRQCGKTTWAGCGQHVKEVMRSVPASQRCPGHDANSSKKTSANEAPVGGGNWLSSLFGSKG